MKAIVCTKYGPPEVLQLKEVEKAIPKDNEVLIRVHAATVTKGDCELRSLKLPTLWKLFIRIGFGFRTPRRKILGQELSGEIESVGSRNAVQERRPSLRKYRSSSRGLCRVRLSPREGSDRDKTCKHEL